MMKDRKSFLRSPLFTAALFALSILLLSFATVSGVRALPLIESQFYSAGVELFHINIQLEENDVTVSRNGERGRLLSNLLPEGQSLQPGYVYEERLAVTNTGTINEYIRVNIYKYWVDADENKLTDLAPEMIDLHLVPDNGWIEDTEASSRERTVLYYTLPVAPGETTNLFADTLRIDNAIASKVSESRSTRVENGVSYTVINTQYAYNGASFRIEVRADGVQDHNPEAAILSAWGRQVSVQNGVLSLG